MIAPRASTPAPCSSCEGTGETGCAVCRGSGLGVVDGTECTGCQGAGARPCEPCEGSGDDPFARALARLLAHTLCDVPGCTAGDSPTVTDHAEACRFAEVMREAGLA